MAATQVPILQLTFYTNLNATVQVAKRNELHKFEVLPQRGLLNDLSVVLDKCRRLWKIVNVNLTLVVKWSFF